MALPSEFSALYRLFLRATSASVLNNGPATRGLRRLYRPTFEAGACAVKKLQKMEKGSKEAEGVKGWLKTFDERINNTLSFFHTSAQSRGLSHLVVSRLSLLSRSHYPWTVHFLFEASNKRMWNPKLNPKSPEYSIFPPTLYASHARKRAAKKAKEMELRTKCWGALGEVIQMAEARDGLVMGRVRFKRQRFRKKKFY